MLERFKNIKPKPVKKPTANGIDAYFEALDGLPHRPDIRHIISVLGTVAAVFVIAAAVSLWAVIGSGVRGNKNKESTVPALENQADKAPDTDAEETPVANEQIHLPNQPIEGFSAVAVTDEMKENFFHFNNKYAIHYLPLFDKDQRPSLPEMMTFLSHTQEICYSKIGRNFAAATDGTGTRQETGEDLNFFSKTLFDVEYDVDKDFLVGYVMPTSADDGPEKAELLELLELDLGDGTKQFEVTYSVGDSVRVLTYIGYRFYDEGVWNSSKNSFDPLKFISCVEKDKPLKKDYVDEKIFYCIRNEVLGFDQLESCVIGIDRVTPLGEGIYSCRAMLKYTVLSDDNTYRPIHLLGQMPGAFYTAVPLYFKYENGVVTREVDQRLEFPLDIDKSEKYSRFDFEEASGYLPEEISEKVLDNYCIGALPTFTDANELTEKQLLEYASYFKDVPKNATEFNHLIYSALGIDPDYHGDIIKSDKTAPRATPVATKCYYTASGLAVWDILYEVEGKQYVLKLVSITSLHVGCILSNTEYTG